MPNLRPYQMDGVNFLAKRRRALLTDLPRLGKTAQALCAARRVGTDSVTVVGPASVRDVWPQEARQWAPGLKVNVLSYDSAAKYQLLPSAPVVVFDEFHRMKNPQARRTQLLLHPTVQRADFVWGLSGTPMPNGPHELFAPCAALWPRAVRALGVRREIDWWNLFTHWRVSDYGRQYLGPKNEDELRAFFASRMLGRTWADVFTQVEPIMWREHRHEIPGEASQVRALTPLAAYCEVAAGRVPPAGQTSQVRHAVGLAKAVRVARAIRDTLDDGEQKTVVVYHHTDVGDRLTRELYDYGVVRVGGSTPGSVREAYRQAFQNEWPRLIEAPSGSPRVFLGQLDAIREGINLSAANTLHLVEPSWTPGYNEQVAMRIARPDKQVACSVVTHVLADTLDEDIQRVLARKNDGRTRVGPTL